MTKRDGYKFIADKLNKLRVEDVERSNRVDGNGIVYIKIKSSIYKLYSN